MCNTINKANAHAYVPCHYLNYPGPLIHKRPLTGTLQVCNGSVQWKYAMEVCNGNKNFDTAEVVDPYGLPNNPDYFTGHRSQVYGSRYRGNKIIRHNTY